MALTNQELNYFFKLEVQSQQQQGDASYIKSLTLASKGKAGAKLGLFPITDPQDLTEYLEDNSIGNFLTEAKRVIHDSGLSQFYLWVLPHDEDFEPSKGWQSYIEEYLSQVGSVSYTLLFSSAGFSLVDDILPLNLTDFDGVIFASYLDYKNIPDAVKEFAKKEKRGVGIDHKKDGWLATLLSAFLAQNTLGNMQYYDKIPTNSKVPAPVGNWQNLFENKLTHLVESRSLGLFAVGGKAIVDIYEQEQIAFDIRSAWASIISSFKLKYNNTSKQILEDSAFFLLRGFQDNGKITSFTTPTFPSVEQQTPENRNLFTLANFSTDITFGSAIWKTQGTIKGV